MFSESQRCASNYDFPFLVAEADYESVWLEGNTKGKQNFKENHLVSQNSTFVVVCKGKNDMI